ncbi:MAG TPA: 30S ribosomal protein S18 [Tepidisphaeraceae bacterium]|nr:30S ribosomal protein S18 [Tepidisphaeraceae bacterium]
MPRPQGGGRERREKSDKFQTFNRPKTKVTRTSADGTIYIDYKDTESLRKMISGNGKILSRKRTGANAMEQRMLAKAIKRSRYMALLPYVSPAM